MVGEYKPVITGKGEQANRIAREDSKMDIIIKTIDVERAQTILLAGIYKRLGEIIKCLP